MPVYKSFLVGVSAGMRWRTHAGFAMSADMTEVFKYKPSFSLTEEAPICCGALYSRLHDPNQPRNLHPVKCQWSLAHEKVVKQRLVRCS